MGRTVLDPIRPESIEREFPVMRQPKITTMARKVVIEAAIPGWHPIKWWRDRGVTNIPPLTIEAQVDAIEECVKAGASVIHTHPRDPKDGLPRVHAPELLARVVDGAKERVDFVTANHTWSWDFSQSRAVDYISYTQDLLKLGKGNRYCEAALVMTVGAFGLNWVVFAPKPTQEGVKWMEANGVKPMFSVQSYSLWHYKEILWDTGIANWAPYWVALQMGKHTDDQTFADPWSYYQVINNIELARKLVPNSFIGIHPGGRNWLPLCVMGLLYGAELIRVGLEDQFWLWPHRDDISQKASDTVEIVANIARSLGREIATAKDVRERLGMATPK